MIGTWQSALRMKWASQGKTIEEALVNLKEAVELYYGDETPSEEKREFFFTTMEVAV